MFYLKGMIILKLEETIQTYFDNCSSAFQRREQALDHLFCTIGNGFEWVDGELVSNDEWKTINPLDENGKAKQYNIYTKGKHRKEEYDRIKSNPCTLELYNGFILNEDETLEQRFLEPKEDDDDLHEEVIHTVYPLSLKYSYLFNYPADIKPDWLEGIKETYEYIIENINEDTYFGEFNFSYSEIFREISKEELIKMYEDRLKK